MEARSAAVLADLFADPAVLACTRRRARRCCAPGRCASPSASGVPPRLVQALVRPERRAAPTRRGSAPSWPTARGCPAAADARQRLDDVERLLSDGVVPVLPRAHAGRGRRASLLGAGRPAARRPRHARASWRRCCAALPHNVTTEMDLDLWALADAGPRPDAGRHARPLPRRSSPTGAATPARCPPRCSPASPGSWPPTATAGSPRSTSGMPRWSDDPTHILGVLANYLRLEDRARSRPTRCSPAARPRPRRSSTRIVARPAAGRAARRGRRGSRCGRPGARRPARDAEVLPGKRAGRAPAEPAGRRRASWRPPAVLDAADDVFFLDLAEARAGRCGARPARAGRRRGEAATSGELRRRHVPRVLLSDGTEPEAARRGRRAGGGRAASARPPPPGTVTGAGPGHPRPGRRAPGARRDPGRAVDRPRLDAAVPHRRRAGDGDGRRQCRTARWSPASTASRRSSACPDATDRIITGQKITVNGAAGTVTITEAEPEPEDEDAARDEPAASPA